MPWQKGKSGNPGGRPKQVVDYGQALRDAVSQADMKRVGKAMYEKAQAGDVAAARLLADFMLPKPAQAIDLTHHRGQLEWDDADTDAAPSLGAEQRPALTGTVQGHILGPSLGEVPAGRSDDSQGGT